MAIYKCKVRGEEKVRLVKAGTAVQTRDHIVEAEAINAEEMAELIEQGIKLEKPGEPAEPAKGGEGDGGDK